jgi:hypothetical protein
MSKTIEEMKLAGLGIGVKNKVVPYDHGIGNEVCGSFSNRLTYYWPHGWTGKLERSWFDFTAYAYKKKWKPQDETQEER